MIIPAPKTSPPHERARQAGSAGDLPGGPYVEAADQRQGLDRHQRDPERQEPDRDLFTRVTARDFDDGGPHAKARALGEQPEQQADGKATEGQDGGFPEGFDALCQSVERGHGR